MIAKYFSNREREREREKGVRFHPGAKEEEMGGGKTRRNRNNNRGRKSIAFTELQTR